MSLLAGCVSFHAKAGDAKVAAPNRAAEMIRRIEASNKKTLRCPQAYGFSYHAPVDKSKSVSETGCFDAKLWHNRLSLLDPGARVLARLCEISYAYSFDIKMLSAY